MIALSRLLCTRMSSVAAKAGNSVHIESAEKPDVAVEMMKAGLRVFKKRGLAGWEVRHISELGA